MSCRVDDKKSDIIVYKSLSQENPCLAYFMFRNGFNSYEFIDSANRYQIGDNVNKYSNK